MQIYTKKNKCVSLGKCVLLQDSCYNYRYFIIFYLNYGNNLKAIFSANTSCLHIVCLHNDADQFVVTREMGFHLFIFIGWSFFINIVNVCNNTNIEIIKGKHTDIVFSIFINITSAN